MPNQNQLPNQNQRVYALILFIWPFSPRLGGLLLVFCFVFFLYFFVFFQRYTSFPIAFSHFCTLFSTKNVCFILHQEVSGSNYSQGFAGILNKNVGFMQQLHTNKRSRGRCVNTENVESTEESSTQARGLMELQCAAAQSSWSWVKDLGLRIWGCVTIFSRVC